jgi:hypothetical protein
MERCSCPSDAELDYYVDNAQGVITEPVYLPEGAQPGRIRTHPGLGKISGRSSAQLIRSYACIQGRYVRCEPILRDPSNALAAVPLLNGYSRGDLERAARVSPCRQE